MKTTYIKDDNFDYSFRLIICDTRKQMIKIKAKEDLRESGEVEPAINEKTMGIFRETFSKIDGHAEGQFFSNVFGTMYLNMEDLKEYGEEIIYHECGHCSFVHEINVIRYTGGYNINDYHQHNERFCDYLGRITSKVKDAVADYKKAAKK
jgi:hypothetical protein